MDPKDFIPHFLRCPRCGAELRLEPEGVICGARDGVVGRVQDGIIDFFSGETVYEEVPTPRMVKIVEVTKEEGWYTGLGLLTPSDEVQRDFVADLIRADFRFLLPQDPEAIVLDLGCGLGTLTQVFAAQSRLVMAVDLTWERLRFAQLRLEQEGFHNVIFIHADITRFRLKPGCLSLALLNGVLEWLPLSCSGGPNQIQAAVLARVREWLAPHGWILIGIENRYARSQLKGQRDPHSGLRGTAILPRSLANGVVRAAARWWPQGMKQRMGRQREGYRTWTHSLPVYSRMLEQAGFRAVQAYIPIHSYNVPHTILPVASEPALCWYLGDWWSGHSLRRRLIHTQGKIARLLVWVWSRTAEDFFFIGRAG